MRRMTEAGNPLFYESHISLARDPKIAYSDPHLENMPAKAMRRLEYVFKCAEDISGPLTYETFRSVIQGVIGHTVRIIMLYYCSLYDQSLKTVYNLHKNIS